MLNQDNDKLSQVSSEKKQFYKTISIKAGIFSGILILFFMILLLFSILGRKSWRVGLSTQIEKVFNENSISEYSIGEYVHLNSIMSVNCAVYRANTVSKRTYDSYAIIIRIPTLYGPVAAVYIYEEKKSKAEFIDFAQINDMISDSIKNVTLNSQIEYWAKKIPQIISTTKEEQNEKK